MTIFYTIIGLLLAYVYLVGWFFAYTHARVLQKRDEKFSVWWVEYPLYVFLAAGALCDILFNWIYGTIAFRELPKEFFFTSRIKRWSRYAETDRRVKTKSRQKKYDIALDWKQRINRIEPGHI